MTNLSNSSTLTQASAQWATRPSDERFISLLDMENHFRKLRSESRGAVVSTRVISIVPTSDDKNLQIMSSAGVGYAPTNWSFQQLATLADSPAGYLRTLPAPIAADCLNYGLTFKRNIEDVGLLLQSNGTNTLRAATGPRYGRIWNSDILSALTKRFGDGTTGEWKVPGEFGKAITVTKANTTLFAGDRDMFVFLANEENRIEITNRRNGQPGSMARGFFVWNSEVGAATFGIATFLFDYVCANRIVWGAQGFKQIKMKHTASAPHRFIEEITPALRSYANATTQGITQLITDARAARLDDVDSFLAKRFGKRTVEQLKAIHMLEEQTPIETLWDVSTAVTAKARGIEYQDERVAMERKAGEILELVKDSSGTWK